MSKYKSEVYLNDHGSGFGENTKFNLPKLKGVLGSM